MQVLLPFPSMEILTALLFSLMSLKIMVLQLLLMPCCLYIINADLIVKVNNTAPFLALGLLDSLNPAFLMFFTAASLVSRLGMVAYLCQHKEVWTEHWYCVRVLTSCWVEEREW